MATDAMTSRLPHDRVDPEEQEPRVEEISEDGDSPDENSDGDDVDEEGGKVVPIDPEKDEQEAAAVAEFYDNLVPELDSNELEKMAQATVEAIKRDVESRNERTKQYTEAIQRTGLGKQAPGSPAFEGASEAVHPMLAQAAIDFAARTIKELFPPNGPVRMFVPGKKIAADRMKKAERKQEYMNWQFLKQMPEFRTELEKLLTQVPLGGSMYLRLTPDYSKRRRRPVPLFIPIDKVSIPYSAANFYTAERQTYHEDITQAELDARVLEGMYTAPPEGLAPTNATPEETSAQKATDKVEGKSASGDNRDGQRIVYEVSMEYAFEKRAKGDPEGPLPYLISIDSISGKTLSVVRNWEQKDKFQDRMQWMVEFACLPWRGAYSVGFGQFIGSLSGAATGALRALLDAALIQNSQTLVKIKGANFTGQQQRIGQTQIVELEGGASGSDIRSVLMALPFPGPSATLFQLLGFLSDAGQGAIHVAMENLAEGRTDMPVGTTLALIEEGMRVMAAIHLRLYHSMDYVINILHRIDRMYLTENEVKNDVGDILAYRDDFEGPLDCIPVADPEVFSDVQRIAQAQIVADRAAIPGNETIYNRRETERMLLEKAKIQNIDRILIPEPKPTEMNQVNENVAMTLGRPVAAFPDQDHESHIEVLLAYLTSPVLGSLPIIAPTFLSAALGHLKEHIAYWYVNAFYASLKESTQKDDKGLDAIMQERDPETRLELDRTLAAANEDIVKRAQEVFKKIPGVVAQAQKILAQYQRGIPNDPNVQAQVEAVREGNQLKAQASAQATAQKAQDAAANRQAQQQNKVVDLQDKREQRKADAEAEFQKLSADAQATQIEEAAESARQAQEQVARLRELAQREAAEDERTAASLASEELRNVQDNTTALKISAAEIESGEKSDLQTGTGVNPSGERG